MTGSFGGFGSAPSGVEGFDTGDWEPGAEDWAEYGEYLARREAERLLASAGYADPVGYVDELLASGVSAEDARRRAAAAWEATLELEASGVNDFVVAA